MSDDWRFIFKTIPPKTIYGIGQRLFLFHRYRCIYSIYSIYIYIYIYIYVCVCVCVCPYRGLDISVSVYKGTLSVCVVAMAVGGVIILREDSGGEMIFTYFSQFNWR